MPIPVLVGAGLAGLFAALWAGLSRLIFSKGGAWVAAIFTALGIGLSAQELLFGPLSDYLESGFTALPSSAGAWFGYLNVDKYCTIVLSGYVGGGIKKLILRKLVA